MDDVIRLGRGREILMAPRAVWEQHLTAAPAHQQARLAFMTPAHHQVRYFVVRELPRAGRPLSPALIAERLGLPPEQVEMILGDLERNLLFLARDSEGAVRWAYPVTVEPTPHHITFNTCEPIYGA